MPLWSNHIDSLQVSWDAHSLKQLQQCPRRYYYNIVLGYRTNMESVDLEFGLKYHDCLELYEIQKVEGIPLQEIKRNVLSLAMKLTHGWESGDSNKNAFTLIRSIIWYIDYWEKYSTFQTLNEIDGGPAVERHFAIGMDFFPDAIEDYVIVGYMDTVVQDSDGDIYVKENKSTKKGLNEALVDSYRIDTQINLYSWAGQIIFKTPIKGLIMDFTRVAVGFSDFMRAEIVKRKEHLQEFQKDLTVWIRSAQQYAMEGYWPQNGQSCWRCGFKNVCSAPSEARPLILQGDFVKKKWDPTISKETVYDKHGQIGSKSNAPEGAGIGGSENPTGE